MSKVVVDTSMVGSVLNLVDLQKDRKRYSMIVQHFLFTMFNLNFKWKYSNPQIISRDCFIDDKYLDNRFKLFERYLIPSIKAQNNPNFKWVVMFSDRTPQKFKDKIETLSKTDKGFAPLFLSDEETKNFRGILKDYISNYPSDIYITSRCDNDDALNKSYIEYAQSYVENKGKSGDYGLIFPLGYQFEPQGGYIRKYYYPKNHFSTYVSETPAKTIFDFLHEELGSSVTTYYPNAKVPMWIETTHGGNVFNCMFTLKIGEYIRNLDLSEDFGLSIKINKNTFQIITAYMYYICRKFWMRRNKVILYIKELLKR